MGTTDLIPGVSGGTVAFVLGIYDRLLDAISGFFSKDWKKHIGFLLPLGVGMVSALLLLSRVIEYVLEHYYHPTQFLFLGLIIGVIPYISKEADIKKNFKAPHFVALLVMAVLLGSLGFIKPDEAAAAITKLSALNAVGLFFAGWLASMAMLLPGISGSFILLIIGVYPTATNALTTFNIPVIAVIGAGVIIGFIVSSKAIKYVLTHFQSLTYAVIIGLIIGSIFIIFPGMPSSGTMVVSIILFLIGLSISSFFSFIQKGES